MSRIHILTAATPALVLACGCNTESVVLTTLDGVLTDPLAEDGPLDEAWVIVDTSEELITARTGADGSFAIADLPGNAPITVTFVAEGRMALTYQDMVLLDADLPLEIGSLVLLDEGAYEHDTWSVSGTISGAPQGAYLMLYGENEYFGYLTVDSADPVPYGFDAEVEGDSYTFTVMGIASDGYTALGGAIATVEESGTVDLALSDALASLEVTTNRPTLDGEVLEELDLEYCSSLGMTHPTEAWGSVTGWTDACSETADGFALDLTWFPTNLEDRLDLYLADDLETSHTAAWASVVVSDGEESLHVDLLDAPLLHGTGDFTPGTAVAWDPVDGVTDHLFSVDDGESITWYILPIDGRTEARFPRFPDDFDEDLITGAGWTVRARYAVYDEDGMDPAEPYLLSLTDGGTFSW
jgi:hypothetical protein